MHVAGGWGLLITSTAVNEKLFLFTSTCESSNSLLTCCESTFDYAIMKRPELHSSILVTTQAGKYDFSTGFLFFQPIKNSDEGKMETRLVSITQLAESNLVHILSYFSQEMFAV